MLQKLICLIGVLCFCFGGSCMNSDNLALPAVMVIVGGIVTLATYKAYEL